MACEQWRIHSQLICIVQKHTNHKLFLKEWKAEEQMQQLPKSREWREKPARGIAEQWQRSGHPGRTGRKWTARFLEFLTMLSISVCTSFFFLFENKFFTDFFVYTEKNGDQEHAVA